jgi:hypothetical protein
MSWRKRCHDFCVRVIFVMHKSTAIWGLSTFFYSHEHKSFVEIKFLKLYSKLSALTFCILFPYVLHYCHILQFSTNANRIECIFLIITWFLSTFTFTHTCYSDESLKVYNRAVALHFELDKFKRKQTFKLEIVVQCAIRTFTLASGFLLLKVCKICLIPSVRDPSLLQSLFIFYLYMPSFMMIFASNYFHIALMFCLHLLISLNESIYSVSEGCRGLRELKNISIFSRRALFAAPDQIKSIESNYAMLHQIFVDFNRMFAKYVIVILAFWILIAIVNVSRARGASQWLNLIN